ncbi:MAG: hypothetical protein HZC41_08555 [Chloroflexi bacterium]|nr:hypothetical protein [Chloroflexota bacterium]
MGLEGLDYILNKKEVVPTVSARDLLERAEQVDMDYKRHVRTYVPISRAANGQDGQLNVEEFERKVIKQVKEARAPRGYLTAEYGYGKTSTALYLWLRAEEDNLIAVPPFQMLELPDLVTATHGWTRYRLSHHRPDLVTSLDTLYETTMDRSIEKEAHEKHVSVSVMREWVNQGRFILDLQPTDYIHYFEDVTEIVLQAGFEGLILLPDEIQQYIEPKIASKNGDPIAPFFNLIQGLATRAERLCFGFIMVIPLKEIGVIREARGRDDLLHRMRELSLDLSSVYDPDFAKRLWKRLAEEFHFAEVMDDIVRPETLKALGEIAAREDISNGPRTVINVFRRMVQRYHETGHANSQPYSPLDLIDDFMNEQAIQFTGNDKIRSVTRRALQSATVRTNPERYEPAIKLAAAFPTEGVPHAIQVQYHVDRALDELMQVALGDLVIAVGPLDEGGVTLSGLDRVQLQREWLPQTIRDFRRAYGENHDSTRSRALDVFTALLKSHVFKGWKVIEERPSNFTSNLSIIFEGDFQSFASRFPRRKVQARILWEDEERKDDIAYGDVVIEYRLSLHHDQEERRHLAQPVELEVSNYTAVVPINLLYVRPEGLPVQIQQALQGVWSPYDLSPLVLMNIYQMLEEKRADNLIPKQDDQYIKSGFQPDLLETVMRDLFNAEVGAPLGAAGAGITEQAILRLLDLRYGRSYRTLMAVNTWRDSLRKYVSALERLNNLYQKRGDVEVEGTKKQIADLMVLSVTALESFMRTFDTLLRQERDWPTRAQQDETGSVKFTLHPLEEQIVGWLRESKHIERIQSGGLAHEVHCMNISDIYTRARSHGYQNEEIEALLNLLSKRELIDFHQQHLIREVPSQVPDLDSVAANLRALDHDVEALLTGFPNNQRLLSLQDNVKKWQSDLEKELQLGRPDPQKAYKLGRNIQLRHNELQMFVSEKQAELAKQLVATLRGLRPVRPDYINSLNEPIAGSVSYVDQVNVLRQALRRHADTVKAGVEQLRSHLEQIQQLLSNPELGCETLAQVAQDMSKYEGQITSVGNQVELFDNQYQHLTAWRRLVTAGSSLYDSLQQMEAATRPQAVSFDRLAGDIRADISSKPASLKLDSLPNHSIYESRLAEISEQVRRIRTEAQDAFTDLQNQYRQALTGQGLFRREQLDRPFEFNFANPGESIRLLHEDVQRRMLELHRQMVNIVKRQRQDVLMLLNPNQLKDLLPEDCQAVQSSGQEILERSEQISSVLTKMESQARDVTVIRDFTSANEGQFAQLVSDFVGVRDALRDIDGHCKQLRTRLADAELSPQEQIAFDQLQADDIENGEDLIEWQRRVPLSEDEFWAALRGLYEKRRIRQIVSRVRR